MEHTEEVFLNHVKEVFQYELPYKEGSWEKFQQQNRKNNQVTWYRWTAKAAAVLLLVSLLLFWHTNTPVKIKTGVLAKIKPIAEKPQTESPVANVPQPKAIPVHKKTVPPVLKLAALTDTSAAPAPIEAVAQANTPPVNVNRTKIPGNPFALSAAVSKSHNLFTAPKKSEEQTIGQWKISPLISNAYGNSGKLKLGFGANVTYAINTKLAINTGATYNQLSALRKTGDYNAMDKQEQGKTLQSVQTAISGLDIPLELKYNLNARNYVSMGVSAMGVLQKSQALNYSELKTVQVTVDGEDGVISESRLVAVEESVPVPDGQLPKQNYIGFYNFSYGFSQKIGKKQVFILEPFIKIPMRPYSDQRTSLTAGGLKLKLEF